MVDEKAGKVDKSILNIHYIIVYFTSTPSSTRVINIKKLKSFEPGSKAMIATLENVEVLSFIINNSNSKPIIFLFLKIKFLFTQI